MNIPDIDSDLEKIVKDPDKRAKLYVYFAITMMLITAAIVFGTIVFILRMLKIF